MNLLPSEQANIKYALYLEQRCKIVKYEPNLNDDNFLCK